MRRVWRVEETEPNTFIFFSAKLYRTPHSTHHTMGIDWSGLRKVNYTVINTKHALLLIDKKPEWEIPSAHFHISFYADPMQVLKYGPNGLHYAEHVLWNVINRRYQFDGTNASTGSGGQMSFFGDCKEGEFGKAMKGFFDGLMDAAKGKENKDIKAMMMKEQRRVTIETNQVQRMAYSVGANMEMFLYNTDLLNGEYPTKYVWKILLEECKLGRAVIIAHCAVSEGEITKFKELSSAYGEAWSKVPLAVQKEVKLPMYYAPPISTLRDSSIGPWNLPSSYPSAIDLSFIDNPIVKGIVYSSIMRFESQYPYVGTLSKWLVAKLKKSRKPKLDGALFWDQDQFFHAPLLTTMPGTIKAEWANDLVSLPEKSLIQKYGEEASVIVMDLYKKYGK